MLVVDFWANKMAGSQILEYENPVRVIDKVSSHLDHVGLRGS